MSQHTHVVAGVGVLITNKQGQILMGKRSSKHAPYWSIFGDMWTLVSPLKIVPFVK